MDSIRRRIESLEARVVGDSNDARSKNSRSLQQRVAQIGQKCPAPEGFEEFLLMFRSLKMDNQSHMFVAPLDAETKRELIKASMPKLLQTANHLEKVSLLYKTNLNGPAWTAAESQQERLALLEYAVSEFASSVLIMHQRIARVMETYGNIVQMLSQKLVSLDAQLEQMEAPRS